MRKLLIIGGGTALLLLSILFGAFFAGPLLASAKSHTTTTSAAGDTYCQQYEQDLAKRLGVSVSTLQRDRQAAFEDILAQMVKDGKLTQAQANQIKQRVESARNQNKCGYMNFIFNHFVVGQFVQKYHTDILNQIAQGLNMQPQALVDQLKAGKSLSQVANAQHVSDSQLQTIVTNAVQNTLHKAVSNGDLTQSQANAFTQFLQKHPRFIEHILLYNVNTKKQSTA
jgi:polyhydroxyalkanoate synthesis regulator phasin